MNRTLSNPSFFQQIIDVLHTARQETVKQVNRTMVYAYFEIGKMIVEEEQQGENRAEYGKRLLQDLSKRLNKEFGKGFSVDNLENMRRLYIVYSKSETVSRKSKQPPINFILSWSHYLKLMRIDDPHEQKFYEIEAQQNNWSVRELQRQYDSALYQRLVLSRDKKEIKALAETGQIISRPQDSLKDPYVLEFLGLPEQERYTESDLEQRLIDKLEHFLLELGKGFTFVARQKRISFDDRHFRVDLVFVRPVYSGTATLVAGMSKVAKAA